MNYTRIKQIKDRLIEINLCIEGAKAYIEEKQNFESVSFYKRMIDDYEIEKAELNAELDELLQS